MEESAVAKVFPSIDEDYLAEELEIDHAARAAGASEQPPSSAAIPDANEQRITSHCQTILFDARDSARSTLDSLDTRRRGLDLRSAIDQIEELPDTLASRFERLKSEHRELLKALAEGRDAALRDLQLFKSENSLNRSAAYPESRLLHWGVMAAIVVAESVLNANFFAKASDLGLLGGVLQALIISLINVLSAAFIGTFFIRNLWHRRINRVIFGGLGSITYFTVLVFGFNLLVAHYRALLESDPLGAVVLAVGSLVRDPFGISNFDAVLLFVIGALFAAAALAKSFKADDEYPGYGNVARRYEEARRNLEEERTEVRERGKELVDELQSRLDHLVLGAKRVATEYETLVSQARQLVGTFETYCRRVEGVCNALLKRYRAVNEGVRTTPAPAYYTQVHVRLEHPTLDLDGRIEADLSRVRETAETLTDQTTAARRRVTDLLAQASGRLEEFLEASGEYGIGGMRGEAAP